jgi:hypothetical protein
MEATRPALVLVLFYSIDGKLQFLVGRSFKKSPRFVLCEEIERRLVQCNAVAFPYTCTARRIERMQFLFGAYVGTFDDTVEYT